MLLYMKNKEKTDKPTNQTKTATTKTPNLILLM
jgi:hypothetical protein